MSVPFPAPTRPHSSRTEVLLEYLDYFRSTVVEKLQGLPEAELRASRLASGWTPLGLLKHLTHVELRWFVWGFAGRPVAEPWGDSRDGRWFVAEHEGLSDLVDALRSQAARTREIVEAHQLSDVGAPGPRWDGAPPATLERVLLHVLQEYARHAGHLDVVRELIDGRTGE